jgi:hypothetical protein
MMLERALVVVLLAGWMPSGAAMQGRRVVDVVKVGDPASEREHEYAGEESTAGTVDGRAYRELRGWLSYSMTVYEDTEVAIACTFRGGDRRRPSFELFVEGRRIAAPLFVSSSTDPSSVEFRVPFELTRGLTGIHVMVRAVDGSTPSLIELRTVQEHLERPRDENRFHDL